LPSGSHFHLAHLPSRVGAISKDIFALEGVGAAGNDGIARLQTGFDFNETVSFLAGYGEMKRDKMSWKCNGGSNLLL
jgi:hypothetical protein